MQDMLKDKDNLNKALTSSCNDLKAKAEQMKAEEEQNKALRQVPCFFYTKCLF